MAGERPSFVISGLGMRCAVGQDAVHSCAAVRAGISRLTEWPYFAQMGEDETGIVGASVVPDLGDRHWIEKLEELATQPILESLWTAGLNQLVDSEEGHNRWGLYLSVPPLDRPGVPEEDAEEFQDNVRENMLFPFEPAAISIFSLGHAGVLMAMDRAMHDIADGRLDIAVVGGVESLLHSEFLSYLLAERKLKTETFPSGIIPGEAAAFIVLETVEHAKSRDAEIAVCVTPVRTAEESMPSNGETPGRADATVRVLKETLADIPCGPSGIQRIINDLNGERWRFLEWAIADARAFSQLPPHWRLWHPADCFGDIGAATGAAHLCIAARAFNRGYAAGQAIVISNSSDGGQRAAIAVFPADMEH